MCDLARNLLGNIAAQSVVMSGTRKEDAAES